MKVLRSRRQWDRGFESRSRCRCFHLFCIVFPLQVTSFKPVDLPPREPYLLSQINRLNSDEGYLCRPEREHKHLFVSVLWLCSTSRHCHGDCTVGTRGADDSQASVRVFTAIHCRLICGSSPAFYRARRVALLVFHVT